VLSLTSLGPQPGEAFELVTHSSFGISSPKGGVTDGRFDARDRAEDGNLILWWRKIVGRCPISHCPWPFSHARSYSRWQPSLYSVSPMLCVHFCALLNNQTKLLHTMYPGQMPTVRRNIFNVVLVLDLSQPSTTLHREHHLDDHRPLLPGAHRPRTHR